MICRESVVHVALTSYCFQQTAPMWILQLDVGRKLGRAIWYVRYMLGFWLVFASFWGCYAMWGAWTLLISPVAIMAGGLIVPGVGERLPRRS